MSELPEESGTTKGAVSHIVLHLKQEEGELKKFITIKRAWINGEYLASCNPPTHHQTANATMDQHYDTETVCK